MASKTIKVADLLLDMENPRVSKSTSQREALQKIIDDQDVKLAALCQSIVQDGLNPMDRFLVIKSPGEDGKYIILEGNRRLASLKIMNNISVLDDLEVRPPLKKRLTAIAKDFDPTLFPSLDCFVLRERNEGAMWIRQRHTGENQGRGIVDWGGVARARFRGNDPALQALDLVLRYGHLTEEEKEGIEDRFPISTLDRLLSTPSVRAKLGFEIQQNKLITDLEAEEAIKPLTRIVRELANGSINVTALKKKEQQLTWVEGLGSDLPNLKKKVAGKRAVESLGDVDFNKVQPQPQQPSKQKKKKTEPVRKALIPKGCNLNVANAKIAEIVKELRALPIADYPHGISVLFRVFLEQSVDHYLTIKGIPLQATTPGGVKDKKLKSKVQDAIADMVAGGVPKKDLDGISKGIGDQQNPLCVDTLHSYVHNRFYSPQERELKVAWDNAQLFFERIWK